MIRKYHILLVSSSGGVLLDLLALEPWWKQHETTWAAVKAADTETVLRGFRTHSVTERRLTRPFGAVLGFFEALGLLRRLRPEVIVSAGSGVAIGFFAAAKILGIPTFWLETLNFIDAPALTGKICSRLASEILIQRPSMLKAHPRGVVLGELY
jgi:UDP-N-acetylglucosamine:LPS N-acetylglucosamine transferase